MLKRATKIAIAISAVSVLTPVVALAQGFTDLHNPYIAGTSVVAPMGVAAPGAPPPVGSGPIPVGVTRGMISPPTLLPYNPVTPANNIDYPSYVVPYSAAVAAPPGMLGPSMYAPPAPSTPGFDPGMIHAPLNYVRPPVSEGLVGPAGGIIGAAPMVRWGGQTSRDFGLKKFRGTTVYDPGAQAIGSISQDGPVQTLPGSSVVQDLYGNRMPLRNNYMPTNQTLAPF